MNPIKIRACLDLKNGRVVKGGAGILLAASVFHFRILNIREVKEYLKTKGLPVIL
jgi:imidazole glycerol-phosphate synthase subunit HisF